MEKRWDAYLAVALDGDDVEIQVDGHAGDIAQIAAMALADVIVQSSPEKEQAIKMLDDMKNRLDGMLDDAWNARSSEIEYGERQSVRWHCEKDTAIEEAMANRKKAEVVMTIAKAIIDERFESIWKREYGNAPAAPTSDPAAPAEKQDDPAAAQPADMDSMMEKIIADAMKQAKENPGQAQGVMFKVPAGDMPMEEVVKHIISAVDKQARKDKNGG